MRPRQLRVLLPFALPAAFALVAAWLVIGPPGAAGHGWGIEAAWYLAMPAVLLLGEHCTFLGLLFAGAAQYAVLGLVLSLLPLRLWRADDG